MRPNLFEALRQALEPRRTERAITSLFDQNNGLIQQSADTADLVTNLLSRVGELEITASAVTDEVANLSRKMQ